MANEQEDPNTEDFSIDLIGNLTKQQFKGKFRAKKFLSYEDHITADRLYRDILGGQNPDYARPYAKDMADTISQVIVRITSGPKTWWPEMEGGLKLKDNNVLKEIFNKAIAISDKAIEGSEKEDEDAKEELKEVRKERSALE